MDKASKIRQAAYLFGKGEKTLGELAVMFKVSRRTMSRWRKSSIWKWQIDLMSKEG